METKSQDLSLRASVSGVTSSQSPKAEEDQRPSLMTIRQSTFFLTFTSIQATKRLDKATHNGGNTVLIDRETARNSLTGTHRILFYQMSKVPCGLVKLMYRLIHHPSVPVSSPVKVAQLKRRLWSLKLWACFPAHGKHSINIRYYYYSLAKAKE
jgi:hypothetical protein